MTGGWWAFAAVVFTTLAIRDGDWVAGVFSIAAVCGWIVKQPRDRQLPLVIILALGLSAAVLTVALWTLALHARGGNVSPELVRLLPVLIAGAIVALVGFGAAWHERRHPR